MLFNQCWIGDQGPTPMLLGRKGVDKRGMGSVDRLQQRVRIIVFHSRLMWPSLATYKGSDVERILRSERWMLEANGVGSDCPA